MNGATNAHSGLHQAIHKLRHGSVQEAKQLLACQNALLATVIAPQVQLGVFKAAGKLMPLSLSWTFYIRKCRDNAKADKATRMITADANIYVNKLRKTPTSVKGLGN
ncbi:hypothetical protein [Nostoc sp. UHCC 0252]|uniref:hypothetical protein n=1 Tax=Nostoc sp. UHCC 0252 TaxID=3110241 RepID=UPI002B2138B5|nr:hypothetical protein [Nostoc sp. UHCC 0252]MEA5604867.1 hypothetical protein [Nostoc sp. UHCC 0252]